MPFIFDLMAVKSILGVDVSTKSLEIARRTSDSERTQFLLLNQYQPKEQMDLTFCNGVFHHIPLEDRATKINYIYHSFGREVCWPFGKTTLGIQALVM